MDAREIEREIAIKLVGFDDRHGNASIQAHALAILIKDVPLAGRPDVNGPRASGILRHPNPSAESSDPEAIDMAIIRFNSEAVAKVLAGRNQFDQPGRVVGLSGGVNGGIAIRQGRQLRAGSQLNDKRAGTGDIKGDQVRARIGIGAVDGFPQRARTAVVGVGDEGGASIILLSHEAGLAGKIS